MAANPAVFTIPDRRVVAVFDLDGTVTRGDTLFAFLFHALGPWGFLKRLPAALPWLFGLALGLVSRDKAKEGVLVAFLRGLPRAGLEARGAEFAQSRLPAFVRPEAVERIAWHKERGHRCAVASASLDVYVTPWAKAAGMDDVFATSLEYEDGVATGRIHGSNCRGEEKVRRMREQYGDLSELALHGYGDTPDDRHFLEHCVEAHYRPFRGAAANETAPPGGALDYLRLMRPHQWVKNAFVFIGVVFGHAWNVPEFMVAALLAAAAFSVVSSAIYIVNDYADRERDRLHPTKRHRPLAAGRVSPRIALGLAAGLALAGATLAFNAGGLVLAIVAAYALMNLGYSFLLKNIVILDVFVIAAGFLLRILAGTVGIGIAPSKWLLVCGLFLTLFLGFTKRRSELLAVTGEFIIHRKALLSYNPALLDKMIGISAGAALMSYSLYTMSPETVREHGTASLIYTIPFVVYGMFRYLYLLHAKQAGSDTSKDLLRDPHLVITVGCWCLATAILIL
jgi:HAD superfamily hydrolase (TIGR01490 family)